MTTTTAPPAAGGGDPASATTDEAILRQMIGEWSDALTAKDLDRMLSQYAADIVLFDLQPPYKVEGLAAYRKVWEKSLPQLPEKFRSEHRDLHLIVSGDVAFAYCLHGIEPVDEKHPAGTTWIRATIGYRRLEGRWRIVHEHISLPFDSETGKTTNIVDPTAV